MCQKFIREKNSELKFMNYRHSVLTHPKKNNDPALFGIDIRCRFIPHDCLMHLREWKNVYFKISAIDEEVVFIGPNHHRNLQFNFLILVQLLKIMDNEYI